MPLLEYHHHGTAPDFYWQFVTCLLMFHPRNVLESPVNITAVSQSKCSLPFSIIFISSIEFPMFFMSQPGTYDYISKTRSSGLLYPALHVKYPLVISHAARPVRVQLIETIYGTEWAGSWSNNPAPAMFIIYSYKEAYVCLPVSKYRHPLPHAPTGTKLGTGLWGIQEQ